MIEKDKVIEIINKMIECCEPFTYEQFNVKIKAKDVRKLRDLEKQFPKVGISSYDTVVEGISTLSIISTITDILCGDRLAFVAEKEDEKYLKNQITKVCWYSDINKEKEK